MGYRAWYYFTQMQSDIALQASLNRDEYDESHLITIRIPLSLPYQTDSKDFQRIAGEVTFEGKIYKYVKRKVENGEFVLLCLPDYKKMRMEKAKHSFFEFANDLTQNDNSKKSDNSKTGAFKKLLSEYDQYSFIINTNSPGNILQSFVFTYKEKNLLTSPHISPEQPPDHI